MEKLRLLKLEECIGKDKLKVLKEYGMNAIPTDLAILQGSKMFKKSYYNDFGQKIAQKRIGEYLTTKTRSDGTSYYIDCNGCYKTQPINTFGKCIRLGMDFSEVDTDKLGKSTNEDVLKVKYGEYPQNAVSKDVQVELENAYKKSLMKKTGRSYTTGLIKDTNGYSKIANDEYTYKNRKYIRVDVVEQPNGIDRFKLFNGLRYEPNNSLWIKVSPVTWLVDVEKGLLVSERLTVAGIPFNYSKHKNIVYENSDINYFINNILCKEMFYKEPYVNTLKEDKVKILSK